MKTTPFDNLPALSKKEALNILSKPIAELELSSDYYKAVFHLFKYPGSDTEKALLDLVKSKSKEHSIAIAKRKAIEVLARLKCKKAIPTIGKCLKSSDIYLVENAVWALKELGCKDKKFINDMVDLMDDPLQNIRLLIQTLGSLGVTSELVRIKNISNDSSLSPGIRGASFAAFKQLSGKSNHINELANYLALPNQNDRQCAVNDVIDAGEINLIANVLKTPVAPSFRMRALNILWPRDVQNLNSLDLFSALDSLIMDNPNDLELLEEKVKPKDDESLVKSLLSTDFNQCYSSLKILSKRNPDDLWPILSVYMELMKKDYGALYFLMILFRINSGWNVYSIREIKSITLMCLGSNWPEFMKFKPVAILNLMKISPSIFYEYIPRLLDEESTPFWACRYAALLAIEKLLEKENNSLCIQSVLKSRSDNHRFISGKAKRIESKLLT